MRIYPNNIPMRFEPEQSRTLYWVLVQVEQDAHCVSWLPLHCATRYEPTVHEAHVEHVVSCVALHAAEMYLPSGQLEH